MARKLVDQDEAARILGTTVEQINALRDRKELFPYRDGDAWKYKPEDLERLKAEHGDAAVESWQSADPASIPLELNDEAESILLSEKELGESSETTSSTIIGKSGKDRPSSDSDIQLAGGGAMGSDVKLVVGGSDVRKDAASSSDLELSLEPVADSGKRSGSDALKPSDSELKLADPSSGSSTKKGSVLGGSDAKKKAGGSDPKGKGKAAAAGEDDVLSGSDITRGAGDSGIHLIDPKDSGLSLEEPLELGGSSVELLELGEADAAGATQLGTEDEFLLTPVQEAAPDAGDSGSQVIALDVDEEMSSGAFTPATSGMVAMLEEDTGGGEGSTGLSPSGALIGGPSLLSASQVAETPYSGWNVTGLVCCALLLMMTGMMMADLYRNLWMWDNPYPVNTSIMDSLEKSIGWMDKEH